MNGSLNHPPIGRIERCTLALCPPAERPWLRAMFAELGVMQGAGQRLVWLTGAIGVLAAAILAGASREVPASMRAVIGLALAVWGATAVLAYRGVELIQLDDDVLIVVSCVMALACAGLVLQAARRIMSSTKAV